MTTEDADLQYWPAILRDLAAAIGRERTLVLAGQVGGISLVVPREYRANHLWATVITEAEWPAVAAVCGGRKMTLPRGVYLDLKKVRIIELAEQGVRVRDIALQCRVSERYVQITLSSVGMTRAVDDPRQLRLPE